MLAVSVALVIVPHGGAVFGGVAEDKALLAVEGDVAVFAADASNLGQDDVAHDDVGTGLQGGMQVAQDFDAFLVGPVAASHSQ